MKGRRRGKRGRRRLMTEDTVRCMILEGRSLCDTDVGEKRERGEGGRKRGRRSVVHLKSKKNLLSPSDAYLPRRAVKGIKSYTALTAAVTQQLGVRLLTVGRFEGIDRQLTAARPIRGGRSSPPLPFARLPKGSRRVCLYCLLCFTVSLSLSLSLPPCGDDCTSKEDKNDIYMLVFSLPQVSKKRRHCQLAPLEAPFTPWFPFDHTLLRLSMISLITMALL